MSEIIWSRRSFLKAALAGSVMLLSKPAFSQELMEEGEEGHLKSSGLPPEAAEGQESVPGSGLIATPAVSEAVIQEEDLPEGRLLLYSSRTGEELDVTYRNSSGEFDPDALDAINYFLRCNYTKKQINMDIRVIEYLNAIDKRFGGGNRIHVISGYRSPEYNALLRKRSRRVAKHSLHLSGRAIDFLIPGVKLKEIRRTAMKMKCGGVGYYPRKGFIHVDSGPFRHW